MILTIKQPNKYYEMKTALRERLLSIAESWHLCSRLRARQVRSGFSSFPFKCRMKRALWSLCLRGTRPCAWALSARREGGERAGTWEKGTAVNHVGMQLLSLQVLAARLVSLCPSLHMSPKTSYPLGLCWLVSGAELWGQGGFVPRWEGLCGAGMGELAAGTLQHHSPGSSASLTTKAGLAINAPQLVLHVGQFWLPGYPGHPEHPEQPQHRGHPCPCLHTTSCV